MPGIFGIVAARGVDRTASAFACMFQPATEGFHSEARVDVGGAWALGRAHLGVLQPAAQLRADEPVQVLFHGDLGDRRANGRPVGASNASDVVRALYCKHGLDVARHIDGSCCAVVLDQQRRRTLLVTDAVGSYPVYWTVTAEGLVFGSELRAVLRHPAVAGQLDPRAVADYLTFGFALGTKTLARGVELVPPGSTVVFDWDNGDVTVTPFCSFRDAFETWRGSPSDYLDELRSAFRQAVDRAFSGNHRFGLSLSGGLDSRAILSAVNGHCAGLATYTVGIKGCADEAIARRLAGVAGTRHSFFELDDRYLTDFLRRLRQMVSLTDGMYLSHGLTEMLALEFLKGAGCSVLVRGHGGELAKSSLAWPLHTDAAIRAFDSTQQLVPYLWRRANYISPALKTTKVFTDRWAQLLDGGARTSLEEAVAQVPLAPPDLCSYLYLTEHHRRSTVPSLELFRQAVEVRTPFVDPRFLATLFRAPSAWRDGTQIHRALMSTGSRRLMEVRNSNTGAPVDAGPAAEFALDKLNSLLRRLNVRGYRHYHNFHGWMRDQLLAAVEAVLLSSESLDRGIVRPEGVQELIERTRSGLVDHGYLLQVLLIIELWQRENL